MIKKIISIFVLLVCTGVMLFGDSLGALRRRGVQTDEMDEDALILWYTDSDYAEYLRDAAVSYEKKNGVKMSVNKFFFISLSSGRNPFSVSYNKRGAWFGQDSLCRSYL